jgi:surface polysaccharide O-acyltransferase-like enzyme
MRMGASGPLADSDHMTITEPAPTAPSAVDTAPSDRRELALDAVRALAMFVVVVWHWVLTIAVWEPTGPRVDNPISFVPPLGYLTWVLQVMPLFFLVGGYVTMRRVVGLDQRGTWAWSRRRTARLAGPAVPLLLVLATAWGAATVVGASAIAGAIVLTATPLWFLVAYLAITALVPLVAPTARRWPVGHVAGLVSLCALWDLARFQGLVGDPWLWLSMVTVWLTIHQLGSLLDRLSAERAVALGLAAAGMLVLGTGLGPYPTSMVGTTTDAISNMGPATAILIALAGVQMAIVALARPVVSRLAERHAPVVTTAARYAMPVYLWHMIGFAACVIATTALGVTLPSEPTLAWWLARPLWVMGPALVAWPVIRWASVSGSREVRAAG